MKCMGEQEAERYLQGRGGLRRFQWRRHVQHCSCCQQRVAQMRRNLDFATELQGIDRTLTTNT